METHPHPHDQPSLITIGKLKYCKMKLLKYLQFQNNDIITS